MIGLSFLVVYVPTTYIPYPQKEKGKKEGIGEISNTTILLELGNYLY
jgi:hypothetical protein